MLEKPLPRDIKSLPGPSGRFRSTWQLMTKPYENYSQWTEQFGKTFLIKALNGNVVVTSNTENIRRVLALRHDQISQFAIGTISPLIGNSSVLIVNGQDHKRARMLLSQPFQKEALRNTIPVMTEVAERVTSSWQVGQTLDVMDAALDYSLEVIIQVVFGVQDAKRVDEFKRATKSYVKSFRPVFAFSRLLQTRLYPAWNRFIRQKQEFNAMLDRQINEYKSEIGASQSKAQPSSGFLSVLMAARDEQGNPLTRDELKDQLITLLFAGHETTQIAISWAISWLHRCDEVLQKLRDELAAKDFDAMLQSDYLNGVCHEALRLNAIVSDFLRVLEQPIELEEIDMKKGDTVGLLTCMVHRDPEIYPEPERFLPERWVGQTYKPHEFLAFGGGVRRCIGANMALLEMKVALITWLRKFKFRLPDDAPSVVPVHRRNLTMAPKHGIQLEITESLNKN